MRRGAEFLAFLSLAVAAHVLLFADRPIADSGQDAGGVGGTARVTLNGAPANIAEVIEDWTRPPKVAVAQPLAALHLAEAPDAKIKIAAQTTPPAKLDQPQQMRDPVQEAAPQIDAKAPPPPPEPKPKEVVEPVEKKPPPKVQPKTPAPKPKERAKSSNRNRAANAGAAAQKAAGAGGSAQAGNSGNAKLKTRGKGQEAKLKNIWAAKILQRIEKRKRPVRGKKHGSVAKVKVKVSNAGELLSVALLRSSGNAKVDREAVAAVKRARKFSRAPDGMNSASYSFNLSIRF